MLLATTSKSSSEHLPGECDLVLHTDSSQGGKKPKSSPLLQGECTVLTPVPLPMLCYVHSRCFAMCIHVEGAPQGLKSLIPQRRTASPHQISCYTFKA